MPSIRFIGNGEDFNIEIDLTKTVLDLKRLIEEQYGILVDLQQLIFPSHNLEDEHTLEHYDIKSDSKIYLVKLTRVYVNIPGKEAMPFTVSPCHGIARLKDKIEEKEGIPAFLQRLVFEDKELKKNGLGYYNIVDNFTIDLHKLIRVNVNVPGRRAIPLGVAPYDTILNMKERITEIKRVPFSEQKLMLGDAELEDGQTLEHYNIQNDCTITLQVPESALGGKINITVKTLTGRMIPLSVDTNDTVERVKSLIYEKEGMLIDQQRLIYGGKQLEDGKALSDYSIIEGAELHVILRLKGGKPVILFYPPKGVTLTNVTTSVELSKEFDFTAVYPKAQEEAAKSIAWKASKVEADGTLTLEDDSHTKCTYLFWEFTGNSESPVIGTPALFKDPSSTMLTDGAHAAEFLAKLLDSLGLTPRERDDMVTYWLHSVQGAKHLLVRVVKQSELASCAALNVNVEDASVKTSVHRVYLLLHPCEEIEEGVAAKMVREPCVSENVKEEFPIVRDPSELTVVEWGGVLLSK